MSPYWDQSSFEVRLEWGETGVSRLAGMSDVVVIVDVLSFSTAVDVATERGACILPYRFRDASAAAFARERGAALAAARRAEGYSLAPSSLSSIPAGARLVLPSPNGSTLTLMAGGTPVLAGCLRNAAAVARRAEQVGSSIAVIAAGERWDDGSLRPAFEDLIGAGAIISALTGTRSPEAGSAAAAFEAARAGLDDALGRCASGRQLIEWGFAADVALAARLNCSRAAPMLVEGAYVDAAERGPGA